MKIGFVGLGVMGEPMCRNLARRSGATVAAFDRDKGALHWPVISRVVGAGEPA